MMNPILFDINGFQIYWYSALILTGAVLGYLAIKNEANRFDINTEFIGNLVFWLVIFAVIGARAYYVAFNWSFYSDNLTKIFEIWNGGLAIHGGIITGLLWIIIYCKKYHVRIARITDLFAVGLTLGQIVGRWGNFFNNEAYGPETTRKFLESFHIPTFIIDGMNIHGTYYQPTFLYESLWLFLGLLILLIFRRLRYTKLGQTTGMYLIWYGIGRFAIEILRQDSLMFSGFKVAQVVSVLMVIAGIVTMVITSRGSKFENLYSEKDANEIKF